MLRAATAEDKTAVATVLIESRREYLPYARSAHPESDVHRWVGAQLITNNRVFVWDEEVRIVGVLAVSPPGTESWINQLYVLPGWTGREIGSSLLRHAHKLLIPPIQLWTFQANTGARRFYERHGYQVAEFTDGQFNEERCPDVRYIWESFR
ncbi:MAG TPA: GNAT family N-acetyltransferase [Roseateles sp.]